MDLTFSLFGFILVMWILMLLGGGIAVLFLGPLSISGLGEFDSFANSSLKAIIAIILVIGWIFVLSKLKNWIFKRQIKF